MLAIACLGRAAAQEETRSARPEDTPSVAAAPRPEGTEPPPEAAQKPEAEPTPESAQKPEAAPTPAGGSGFPVILGTLPGGKSLTIRFRTTVNNPFVGDTQQVSNQGSVSGSNFPTLVTNDPDTAAPNDPTLTPIDLRPDVAITKSDGGASVAPGGTVAYTLAYSNLSTFGALGVVLTDTVPALTTFNPGASSAGWACVPNNNAGSVCTLTVGLVSGGTAGSRVFAVTVASPVAAGVSQISNTASVASSRPDPDLSNNSASDTTPVDAQPDLTITKSDGGVSTTPGGTVAYTLTYQNVGNQGATGVVLSETVPANTTFTGSGWTCVPNNNAGSSCTRAVGGLAGGGGSGSAPFAVTVASPVPAGVAQISNTASVADDGANGPDPAPANNTATDTTPLTAAPDLTIAKSDGGATATPGGTVTYTLTFSNVGNQDAAGVTLTDVVPANTTFDAGGSSAGWTCTPNPNPGSTCTNAVGAAAAGAPAAARTFAVTVANPVPAGVTQISNTGTIADDGTNGPDPTPANNSSTDTTPLMAAPDLTLVKSDGGVSTAPGGTVVYALQVANVGTQGATGVSLSDVVPANTTFNPGASTAGWTCVPNNNAGSTCNFTVGGLAGGGATTTVNYAVTVVDPFPVGTTQISNTASVGDDGTNGPDPTPANNTSSDTTPVVAAPDMTITKSDGGVTTPPGGTVPYTLAYANAGNRGATGVVLTDVVPASTTFNPGASTAGWVCTPNNNAGSSCTLAIGSVAAGTGGSAVYAVTVPSPAPAGLDAVSNTATVAEDGTNGPDPNPTNNTSTDTTPVNAAPDLFVITSDNFATAIPGNPLSYAIGFRNEGNQTATGVVLTSTVPAHTAYEPGLNSTTWTCAPDNNAGSTCTHPIGSLTSGTGLFLVTFVVRVSDPVPAGVAQLSFTVSIADNGANGPDPTPANNTSTDVTDLVAAPDLAIVKSDGGAGTSAGGTVTYTLSYSNDGHQGATGVVLTDVVPASTTFDPTGSTAGWSCTPDNNAGSTCTLTVGGLAGGGTTGSATFAVIVDAVLPPGTTELTNTGTIADDGTNGSDPTPANNSSTDTTPVQVVPDVVVTELVHGSRLVESLAALAGPTADTDLYRISQKPNSSYEVVVDGTAGGVNELVLERLDADGTTVLQTSVPAGVGIGRSLRFRNESGAAVDDQFVRVRSGGCGTSCGADAGYRLRAYETTYTIERFNNVGNLNSVVILQNRSGQAVNGTIWFWSESGAPVGNQAFTMAPHEVFVFQSVAVAPNASGSITVTSDAPYATLAGKAAVLDPINGPAQDVIMKARIR